MCSIKLLHSRDILCRENKRKSHITGLPRPDPLALCTLEAQEVKVLSNCIIQAQFEGCKRNHATNSSWGNIEIKLEMGGISEWSMPRKILWFTSPLTLPPVIVNSIQDISTDLENTQVMFITPSDW